MRIARAVGWLFVAVIGYHAVLAAFDAVDAGGDRSWPRVVGYSAIAFGATVLVVGAIAHEVRSARRRIH